MKKQAEAKAKEHTAKIFAENAKMVKAARKKLARIQNKYISVLSSDDLSSAVKRSSLKGKPLKQRLFLGGNFNVNNLKPQSLDFSPQVGYKFNRRFIVGIGGSVRHTFGDTINVKPSIPANSYGYKGFVSYDVIKNFFAYGEFERVTLEKTIPNSDKTQMVWQSNLLAGVGRRIRIHSKVDMNVIVLYNFFHNPERAVYPRPWAVKFGFNLSELGMVKR